MVDQQFVAREWELSAAIRELAGDDQLHATWDAGGDETPVVLFALDSSGERRQLDWRTDAYELIRRSLIGTLHLPNASDGYYHTGRALLEVNDLERPVARVTSRDYCMEYPYEWDSPRRPLWRDPTGRIVLWIDQTHSDSHLRPQDGDDVLERPIEARHWAESVLHRADITLVGEIDRDLNTRTEVIVDVQQGDEVDLDDETLVYYREVIEDVLIALSGRFDSDPAPVGIYVEAQLVPGTTARFQIVTDGYQILRLYDDTEVTLVPRR